ncbi:NAD-dependent protein deacylase [Halobacillus sp. KGW1]|uniref:NAD-dependent protein deacylase n=1 Tax=Halobacillus sp. KGW1 TaxID=1793726 RepID=UPI0007860D06|nr:NAD-dependent protein deacylase [Halobacillus sp. KGW1]
MKIEEVRKVLDEAERVVVLTGAGVSTASGIPDFRSSQGLWTEDHSREYYMSADYFHQNPQDFWNKYKEIFRLKLLQDYEPNDVHHFLKQLEEGRRVSIITQNVDGLHERAGSTDVLEYHGTLGSSSCTQCGNAYPVESIREAVLPSCISCGSVLRPDVMLFGDPITLHEEAEARIEQADVLLVMGTSLTVTPFSLLPYTAAGNPRITTVIINREATGHDHLFDYVIHGDLTEVLRALKNKG